MKKFLALCIIALPLVVHAQVEKAKTYAETITTDDLKDYLNILASDALEGRETGERGQQMAAAFIKSHFDQWGLEAPVKIGEMQSFYQHVPLYISKMSKVDVSVGNIKFPNYDDIMYYGQFDMANPEKIQLVYAGDASAQALEAVDVKGKAVVITGDGQNYRSRLTAVNEAGAALVFVSRFSNDEEFDQMTGNFRHFLEEGRLTLEKPTGDQESKGIFFVSPGFVSKAFNMSSSELEALNKDLIGGNYKALKKVKPATLTYQIRMDVSEIKSENVLGYLPGTDLKDELVVLTAHYDHVGKNGEEVYNGADDDGSGTAAVMEIAEAFATAAENGDRPRRSLLFMLVTGEEKGLLGSKYYTDINPIYPLNNTVANLNIDMIGRIDPKHEENPNYVYLVGSDKLSKELHELSENINSTTIKMDLDYTYNDENHPDRIYYRSDHWNFAKNNVPIIFYFNGVHADYHKPTDTVDKIEWDLLKKRTHLVFYTAWELANRDKRPAVDKAKSTQPGR